MEQLLFSGFRARIVAGEAAGSVDMCCTCMHVGSMGKMVQIRNMPDKMHRTLKVRAAHAGLSLSDYLMRELRKSTEAPTREELVERLRGLSPVKTKEES